MDQVIVARDETKGYTVVESSFEVYSEILTYLLPTITSRKKPEVNYIRKVFAQDLNKIIVNFVWSDGLDPFNRPKAYVHSLILDPEEYQKYTLMQLSTPFFDKDGNMIRPSSLIENKIFSKRKSYKRALKNVIPGKLVERVLTQEKVAVSTTYTPQLIKFIHICSVIEDSLPSDFREKFSFITYSETNMKNDRDYHLTFFVSTSSPQIEHHYSSHSNKLVEELISKYSNRKEVNLLYHEILEEDQNVLERYNEDVHFVNKIRSRFGYEKIITSKPKQVFKKISNIFKKTYDEK
ncbi:MAG: hypothetical protein KAR35_01890 [Candidatus Heimdallarchaeota archaeon]|nr:hypothetical protein [Candidatus Heimdallarchaeota archaeon]MCK5048104.1 hypothetical protein [Candidatus Heimdallarchaeota archaeon]